MSEKCNKKREILESISKLDVEKKTNNRQST
jgi:hypothetical protein